jgi:type I restriction enzyme R subunit
MVSPTVFHCESPAQPGVLRGITDLNPELAKDPDSAEMVLEEILTTITSAADGLVAANERMTVMLRGEHAFVNAHGEHILRRLIDFDIASANKLVVADEVTIGTAVASRHLCPSWCSDGHGASWAQGLSE